MSREVTVVNSKIDVALQDQTTHNLNLHFVKNFNQATLSANTNIDDKTITLNAPHYVEIGSSVCIKEDDRYYQGHAISIDGNIITLDTPLDYAYTTAAHVGRGTHNLAVDGSSTT